MIQPKRLLHRYEIKPGAAKGRLFMSSHVLKAWSVAPVVQQAFPLGACLADIGDIFLDRFADCLFHCWQVREPGACGFRFADEGETCAPRLA